MLEFVVLADTASPAAGGGDLILVGGIVAVAQVVGELGKALVVAVKQRGGGSKNGKTSDGNGDKACAACQSRVQAICETVNRCDENGTPLVYSGRRLIEKMDVAVDEMRKLSRSQDRVVAYLESTVKTKGVDYGKPD
ncbi:MAG: hypothetical protein JXO22_15260 [Phycisphaerae bacterium]|nr:hypothetical protein [Phycisphaerae bacterium]